MVNIRDIRASNSAFKSSSYNSGLVAVFVGATSGIGMGTLKQFAKHANTPKVYIIGRSRSAAKSLLDEVQASNPKGTFEFVETEITLMKNVDRVCEEIELKEKKVDILFMTPGALNLDGKNETTEGIDVSQSLRYYCRFRFVFNLLALLKASSNPRVISIFGGGKEKVVDLSGLELQSDFTAIKASTLDNTKTTLTMEYLSSLNHEITFIHKFPGFVNTGAIGKFLGSANWIWVVPATVIRYSVLPVLNVFATSVDEAGERGLFLATSARYAPPKPTTDFTGVELPAGLDIAKSSVEGNGVYRLGPTDESAPDGDVLPGYRKEGAEKNVWLSTLNVWEAACFEPPREIACFGSTGMA